MRFIIKPLLTEKMNSIMEKTAQDKEYTPKTGKNKGTKQTKVARPVYGFLVQPDANKLEIKQEVESLYGVKVDNVNTMRYAGKRMARYTKAGLIRGQRNAFKKALVTLKEGQTIDFFSNI